MSKKILIISRSFYPDNYPRSFRTTELAKELSRQGHQVTVLTPKREEHDEFARKYKLQLIDLGTYKWPAFTLKGSGLNLFFRKALNRLLLLMLQYPALEIAFMVKRAIKQLREKDKKFDILISIAHPHPIHWGVALTWSKKDKTNIANTWIADCGDPFMGAENDSYKPFFYFKYVEKWLCKKVDYLTVPVETAIPAYYPEFHHKIKVIPQGFNFSDVKIAPQKDKTILHFAYAGVLISGRRDPKDFFRYLIELDMDFQFDIYTNSKALVEPFAEKSNGRIRIKSYIPRLELLYELSKLDFVVNFENAGQKQIPSKLIDYSIIDIPILSINSFKFDPQITSEFMQKNYSNRVVLENMDDYKIENVTKSFLALAK